MRKKIGGVVLPLMLLGAAVGAQEKSEPPAKKLTPLTLQVVLSRYQGDKRISNFPYTLSLNADDVLTKLRMGIQVPIQVKDAPGSVVYKDVGNNIDCRADALADGRFKVSCSVDQSSVYSADGERRSAGSAAEVSLSSVPLFRTFRSESNLVLRDGQTAQYTAATDPLNGEVLKVEVTLTVVK